MAIYPGWDRMKKKLTESELFKNEAEIDSLHDTYAHYANRLFVSRTVQLPLLIYSALIATYKRDENVADDLSDIVSIISKPSYYAVQCDELPSCYEGYKQLKDIAEKLTLLERALEKELFKIDSAEKIYPVCTSFLSVYRPLRETFLVTLREYMFVYRRAVNTVEHCVLLAKEYSDYGNGCITVLFENGTAVELGDEEPEGNLTPEEYAIGLLSEASDIMHEYSEVDFNDGKNIFCVMQSSEMGCMNGIFTYYDESEPCWNIDREIALVYRKKDEEEKHIIAVLL